MLSCEHSSDPIEAVLPPVSAASLLCAADAELKIDNVKRSRDQCQPHVGAGDGWSMIGARSVIQHSEREQ